MRQTRLGSWLETGANIVIGFAINWIANMLILPRFGFHVTGGQAFHIGLFFSSSAADAPVTNASKAIAMTRAFLYAISKNSGCTSFGMIHGQSVRSVVDSIGNNDCKWSGCACRETPGALSRHA